MATANYQKSYSILGVFQDDDWDTVRSAYKRQIRRWHPDRFQDPDQRKIAEDKSKEINLAYQMLDDYYRQFGVLPPEDYSRPNNTAIQADTYPEHEIHTDPKQDTKAGTDLGRDTFDSIRKPARYTGTLLAVTVVTTVYLISEPIFTGKEDSTQTGPARVADTELAADNYKAIPADSISPLANNTVQEGQFSEWQDNMGDPTQFSHPAATKRLPYITRGSTKQDVLAIQGRPLRETDTAWDYGLSRINFHNGKVTDWYENPMNPLIVQR